MIYEGEDGADGQREVDWDALTMSDNLPGHRELLIGGYPSAARATSP
jgi:hypothetical protein